MIQVAQQVVVMADRETKCLKIEPLLLARVLFM
jgi:hypothetical protein